MLQVADIKKQFPGTLALDNVSVTFDDGRIHALVGKNGAGKSTLVKIIAGAQSPDHGTIFVDGCPVALRSPRDAFNKGIATVHQELSLVPALTVAENILLGRLPKRKLCGLSFIDWDRTFTKAQNILEKMDVNIDVKAKASTLGVAQQQVIEIAKAMSFDPSVLILDEPTSALAQHETESLFALVKNLAKNNVAVIFITHRLEELTIIADQVTVLRDGRYVDTVEMQNTSIAQIVDMMFGTVHSKIRPADLVVSEDIAMGVDKLSLPGKFQDVSFKLYKGEVLGIAGLLGSGRTELLKAIFGAEPFKTGTVTIGSDTVSHTDPVKMKKLGVAFTPENRKEEGLVQILSTRDNICMAALEKIANHGFISALRQRTAAEVQIENLDINVADPAGPVSSLSGGNQQKVVVANWLNTDPKIILFDEPTRGIDVQAKQQIFQVMWDLSRRGISSIFVSSELEELLEVCHRILIMKNGNITEQIEPACVSVDRLFKMCMEN